MKVIPSFSIICLFSLFVFSFNQSAFAEINWNSLKPYLDPANISLLAIILAFSSIGAVIVQSYQTRKQLKQDADTKFNDQLIALDTALTEHIKTEQHLETQDDCEYYIQIYLDMIQRIAFLEQNHTISDEMTIYFAYYFQYALTIKNWYIGKFPEYTEPFKSRWERIDNWCKDNRRVVLVDPDQKQIAPEHRKLKPFPETLLPYALLNHDKLPEK